MNVQPILFTLSIEEAPASADLVDSPLEGWNALTE